MGKISRAEVGRMQYSLGVLTMDNFNDVNLAIGQRSNVEKGMKRCKQTEIGSREEILP